MIAWDLFCRDGGFSVGLQQSGIKIILGIDIESRCSKAFESNLNAKFICSDINALNIKRENEQIILTSEHEKWVYPRPNILVGGPPCNEHSPAGYGWNHDPWGKGMICIHTFYKFVRVLRPDYWIAENVPQIEPLWHQFYPHVRTIILNAADYGVPSIRNRCFAGNFPIPATTHSKSPFTDLSGRTRRRWINWEKVVDGCEGLPNQEQRTPLTDKGRAKITRGFGMQKRRMLKLNSPAFGLTDMHGDSPVDPRRDCCLSVRECARIQTFPDNFVFYGGKGFNYSCIGLSVPPLLARKIGESIVNSKENNQVT